MSHNAVTMTRSSARNGYALHRVVIAVSVGALLVAGFFFLRQALNTHVLGANWDSRFPGYVEDIDHSRWDRLLKKYVDDKGLVRYRSWHANDVDRTELRNYLELLASTGIDSNGNLSSRRVGDATRIDHEIAYWVNAYNALVIEGILEVYPTDSIRQHANPVGYDIRQHLKLMTGGRAFSLDDIEQICLTRFHDPRVRFAISNASKSCPLLLNRAWNATDVQALLDQCSRGFLNSNANLSLDKNNQLRLAKLLDESNGDKFWLAAGSWRILSGLIGDEALRKSVELESEQLVFTPHDWSLNEKR